MARIAQPDEGNRCKAATIKRAAVLWDIGRYLYQLGGQWLDYDARAKKIAGKPTLPTWAANAQRWMDISWACSM
jgi:hypothetical protein